MLKVDEQFTEIPCIFFYFIENQAVSLSLKATIHHYLGLLMFI